MAIFHRTVRLARAERQRAPNQRASRDGRCGRRPARCIGPRLVSFRERTRPGVLELRPQVLAKVMQIRIRPTVVGFDRVGGQVVELPLVIERRRPIGLSPKPIGRQMAHAGFGPGTRIVEGADQLP